MKKVDGLNGKKFLLGVLIAYFFVFLFSYCYFMVASPIIIGKAIAGFPEERNSPQIIDPALIKTFSILAIIVAIVFFVYVIPKLIYKKQTKNIKHRVKKYSAFKTH